MTEVTRLKKFLTDQEEAVQLARSTPDGANPVKVDALNGALSLAHCNAEPGTFLSVAQLLKDAQLIEAFLKSPA